MVGISYDEAKDILQKYTNAFQVSHEFWFGLPLNTTAKLNFTAQVEVYRDEKTVTLNNIIGTIPGRYVGFKLYVPIYILVMSPSRAEIISARLVTFFPSARTFFSARKSEN